MSADRSRPGGLLEITTVRDCSVDCRKYCPQKMVFRPAYGPAAPRRLEFDQFTHAISTIPANVKINFAGFSEPFLNNRALDMMEHARAKGHEVSCYSTLVGLQAKDVPRLAALGMEELVVHLPDDQGVANIPDTENYRETLSRVLRTCHVRRFSRMGGSFVSNERAGNCEGVEKRHIWGPIHCGKLIDPEFVMLPDGRTTLCCMDWKLEHIVGNLLTDSWSDLLRSAGYQGVIRATNGLSAPVLCRSCTVATPVFSRRNLVQIAGQAMHLAAGTSWRPGEVMTT